MCTSTNELWRDAFNVLAHMTHGIRWLFMVLQNQKPINQLTSITCKSILITLTAREKEIAQIENK